MRSRVSSEAKQSENGKRPVLLKSLPRQGRIKYPAKAHASASLRDSRTLPAAQDIVSDVRRAIWDRITECVENSRRESVGVKGDG